MNNSVVSYIAFTKKVVAALKQVDPNIQTMVTASKELPGFQVASSLRSNWNATLAKESFYSGVIVHACVSTKRGVVGDVVKVDGDQVWGVETIGE